MTIINYSDPFILWASARTASSAFFYEYASRNNSKVMHMNHEPLNLHGVRSNKLPPKGILGVVSSRYSFKCMINKETFAKHGRVGWELQKLKKALPVMDYRHIIIHRKDLYSRQKSYVFSQTNNVWSKRDVFESKDFNGWMNLSEKEFRWKEEHAIEFEKEVLDRTVEMIKIFEEYDLPYQIIEFEEACKYIGKDTSQGTKQYYGEWESSFVKEEILKLKDHEFYKNYAA